MALDCKKIIPISSITLITHLNICNVVVGQCHKLQNLQNIHKKSYLKGLNTVLDLRMIQRSLVIAS